MADSIRLDPRTLRGLAHPVRVKMLNLLREHGPSTATRLAELLNLNSAATSYHLRQLASHGFIVEDPTRGTQRERWWQAAHKTTTVDSDEIESLGDLESYLRAVVALYYERTERAVSEISTRPQPWRGVGTFSDWSRLLDPVEAEALNAELVAVVERYRPYDVVPDAPEDATRVCVQLQLFPIFDGGAGGDPA